ncbi:7,8-didemethyl-8-hydroxy-5-deazariboflavin synthase subunit CofG [Methanosalsum natronophilum]|uniref:7,8-didemethyl-8-hydroxy-5-deazariboflavin synthase n=1 Tax=Methanosalsum natronophilum TaxID=768733 RepID=A0A424YW54_9EURY|nr:7,8-didemethyl-8-hydroxy-5-deazariboflavin synthase subunit CofG [Methanosalsum natronophilum]MCS3923206.1 FO synthase subunit 1 [Methanosalsum natronophilum]RQD83818.1 MAG: 7,8-didemethyl-8-hydroxy-5-deazariboflavin synthase subunit CofG [Methanosalsum natronophilum]
MPSFVTFAKNVFIPVTNICRNNCGYCGFKRELNDPEAKLMTPQEIAPILSKGKELGCSEALFTFGECPEDVSGFSFLLEELGFSNYIDYIIYLCELAIESGLLPHTNAGIIDYNDLKRLGEVNSSLGLMLETTANLPCHHDSPGKRPEKRVEVLKNAGKLRIPFTTGILVGIGETRTDRINSLKVISQLHEQYGHIQEVIIQNFKPKIGTGMENKPNPKSSVMIDTVKLARDILQDEIAVQVPPNLIEPRILISAGATDLGGISPETIDWINPESSWPSVDRLQEMVGNDITLRERLPIHPQYIDKGWYSSKIAELITKLNFKGYKRIDS